MVVDWSMVLELARASSLEIQLAGEKVHEADIQHQLARLSWIPSLKVGTTWYNSSGQHQLIPGQVITASKSSLFNGALASAQLDAKKICLEVLRAKQQIYARSGEFDRVTRAELQKVSNAYIDLVAAQAGAAISAELQQLIGDLVERSRLLLQQGLLTEVNVLRKEQQLQSALQQASESLSGQQAAGAQLVMLLDLEPGTRLVASWDHLAPVTLVDENGAEKELVARALSQGPGIAEIDSVLTAIAEQQQKLRRLALLPTLSTQTGFGAFGGGTGSNILNTNDRFDVTVGAFWDVTEVFGTKQTRELFNSKKSQALLEHRKLEGRLAAGVIIARRKAIEARKRIELAEKEVDLAIRAYQQSKKRMDADVVPGREVDLGSIEVLPAIGGLAQARSNYLNAVIEYNKSQIELLYLIGADTVAESYNMPTCHPQRFVNGKRIESAGPQAPEVELVAPTDRVPLPTEDFARPVSAHKPVPAEPADVSLFPVETIDSESK